MCKLDRLLLVVVPELELTWEEFQFLISKTPDQAKKHNSISNSLLVLDQTNI